MRSGNLYATLFNALTTAKRSAFIKTLLLASVLLCSVRGSAQTYTQVTSFGTTTVAGTTVTETATSGTSSVLFCSSALSPFSINNSAPGNSFSFGFSPAISGMQLKVIFSPNGAGALHLTVNGISYTLLSGNLSGALPSGSRCGDATSAVISGGNLTNAGDASGNPTGLLTVTGTISNIVVDNGGTSDGVTFGLYITPGNTTPTFAGGSTQSLGSICNGAVTSINSKLTITDPDAGQTETFSVTSAPTHGTITTGTTVGSGTSVSPTGWSYTPTSAGADAFTIQVSDGAGGTASSTISVTVNALPTISAGSGITSCSGSANTLTATGGTTYTWAPATSLSATTGTSVTASPTSNITYTVTGTDALGCSNTGTVTVNTITAPTAITGTPIVCVQTTSPLGNGVSGGTWTSSNISLATVGITGGLLTGYGAGNPTITYTLSNGCFKTVTATVNPLPDSTFTITPNHVCLGNSSTFAPVVSGATLYSWNFADGNTGTGNPSVHTYTVAAIYTPTLTVTNSFGCVSNFRMQTTINALPVAITGTASVCVGLNTTLSDATGTGSWTSSAPGTATVGSVTGVVNGVAAGNANITYTTSAGCTTFRTVTVNALPGAIGSLAGICPATSITLTDGTAGGTWTSSNTAVATIVGSTGTVTGVSSGSSTITYTLPTGCIITALETVNPNPPAITGAGAICSGSSLTLADGIAGGTWSSGTTSVATVGTSGVVLGVSGGSSVINYTLPTTCTTAATVTVNALPNAITGTPFVCTGSTTALSTTSTGGTWSSSNILQGSVSPSGTVAGISAGIPNISYTLPTGCFINIPVTVSATPAAITGASNVCVGSTVTLADATPGGTWSSTNTAFGTISTSGVVTGISNGTLNISYTSAAGCGVALPFTVNITPSAITGTATVCTTTTTTLNSTPSGGAWTSSNTALATVISGTGVVTGVAAGIPIIAYTLSAGSCKATIPVTVLATPAAIAGSNNVCTGTSTTLTDATGGGTWTSGATGTATIGLTSGIMNGVAAGTTVITYTSAAGCNNFLNVTVNTSPSAISGSANVCLGTSNLLTNTLSGGAWTSSNTAIATVGTTGSVSGITTGNATITYTVNPGACIAILPVTVNMAPASIGGLNFVCTGLTTVLTDATASGLWSSSTTANATVGSGTGIVSGLTAGTTTTISYTLANGCSAILPMSVNLQPAALTGTMNVCTGLTTTLTETTTGGTWSSSNTALDTVNTSGVVTGISTGTPTISYTLLGCAATQVVTVNPSPAGITGSSAVCTTQTITLSDGTTGGLWSSSIPATGSVGATTGVVTGIAAGNIVISYTLATGCTATKNVTVNAMPNTYSISAGGSYCSGGPGIDITLSGSDAGISYQLYNGTTASGSAVTGGGSTIDFGFKTAAGTYTVVATNTVTGCTKNMSGSSIVSINPLPTAYSVNGGGGYCTGGTGVHVGLNNSNIGISYQLLNGGSPTGLPSVAGTGIALDFGLMTTAGTYTVLATNSSTSCTNTMLGSTVVTINPLPTAITVTGGGSYCIGGTGVDIGLATPTTTGVNYQLLRGTTAVGLPIAGSGSTIDFGLITTVGTYSVFATNTTTTCSNTMANTVVVTINALPVSYLVSGGGGYCPGTAGSVVNLSNSTLGVNYNLILSGTTVATVAGSGSGISFPAQTTAGTYTVSGTNGTSCTNAMTGSVTISVNPLPTTFSVTGGGGYCTGGTGVHLRLSGSALSTSYQLYNGSTTTGTAVIGSGGPLDFGIFTAVGTYTVSATSSVTSCSTGMAGSQVVTINPLPTAFAMSASGGFCVGATGIDVQLLGSATGVTYQLYRGTVPVGIPVGGTGSAIDYGNQTIGGTYTVTATVTATTCSSAMTGSTTVTANPLPTAFTVTGGGSYCASATGVHVFLSGSSTGVTYSLINSSTTVATATGTGTTLDFGLQTATGGYTVTALSTAGCSNNMTGSVSVSINPLPTAYVVGGGGSYCATGTGSHITLGGSNTGINYQLYYGTTPLGSAVAGGASTIDFGAVTGVGVYSVSATNPATGCTKNMTGTVSVSINALPIPYPVTVGSGGLYCAGGVGVPVGVSITTSGTSYQLYRNGTSIGSSILSTGVPISFGNETLAGTYSVVATSGPGCTNNMAGTVTVSTNPLPTTYSIAGGGGYCPGSTTGVHVTLSGSNTGINYLLYKSGTSAGTFIGSGSTIDFGGITATGTYTAIAMNPVTSCTVNMLSSVTVSTNILPTAYTMTGGGSYCIGSTGVPVGLSNAQGGVNYQLYNGTTPIGGLFPGTSGTPINFGMETAGSYSVIASDATTSCTQVMTLTIAVTATSLPTPFNVTGGGNYCAGSGGSVIGLDGSLGGISYQLYVSGTPTGFAVPGGGGAISFGAQTTAGTYTVMATGACSGAMAGSVNVGINPVPADYPVSGGGNYCAGGTGVHVGLGGSQSGIKYQLYNTGAPVGGLVSGTGTALDFGLQTAAGSYTVVATNLSTTCADTTTGAGATVGINTPPTAYPLSGGSSYCAGGAGITLNLSFTDLSTAYQVYDGTTAIGTPVTGISAALSFGPYTAAGIYSVVATDLTTTCKNTMIGNDTVTINPLPTTYIVSGGGTYCDGGAGMDVMLSNSNTGISYQLYNGTTPATGAVAGTGSAIDFGDQAAAGVYTVIATNSATTCHSNMVSSAVVGINPAPASHAIINGGSYCAGASGVHIGLAGSDAGISYQLFNGSGTAGSPVFGTGASIDFGLFAATGTYKVVATNLTTGCANHINDSTVVSTTPLPIAYAVSSSASSFCAGGAGVHVFLSNGDATVSYQLYRGTVAVGPAVIGSSSIIDFGAQTVAGTYTVMATNGTSCSTRMTGSAVITINPAPDAFSITGGGSYCTGGTGVHVGLAGSSIGTSYQLNLASVAVGIPVPGTGSALDLGVQTASGAYTITATNTTGCVATMTGSASVGINTLPAVFTVTGGGNYCAGTTGIPLSLTGSSTGTKYRLYLGTTAVGSMVTGTGSAISLGTETAAGTYTAVAVNDTTGCTSTMTSSAVVGINPLPGTYAITGGGNFCPGSAGVHIGLSGSHTGITYQLFDTSSVIGAAITGTGLPIDFGLLTGTGHYTIVATDASTMCTANMTGTAIVSLNVLPSVYTVSGGGGYCAGTAGVHIGLSNSSIGVVYQLHNGTSTAGSPLAGTGSAIDFGTFTTGTYTAVATSSSTSCTSNMTGTATVSVNPTVTPSVSIASGTSDTVCSGTLITFTAVPVNGGTTPAYQWTINGVSIAAASSYAYLPANGDVVSVTLISSALCPFPATANNAVEMTVLPQLMPSVTTTVDPGTTVCQGTAVTFTAAVTNGGTTPVYVWKLNSITTASTSAAYTFTPANGDVVYCQVTSNYQCALVNTVASTHTAIEVDIPTTPIVAISANPGTHLANGQNVVFTANVTNGVSAVSYQWSVNGAAINGATTQVYITNTLGNLDNVSCTVTTTGSCSGLAGSASTQVFVSNVGVQQVSTGNDAIILVPNPNKGIFTLKGSLANTMEQEVTIEITNMLGQVIYNGKAAVHNGDIDEKIQLGNNTANGMYLLNLRTASGNKVFHMVVEQ